MSSSMPLRCKCRRQAVTSLRCSRCSVAICPDCSVPAPAGMLCRECSSGKSFALFQVSAGSLAQAFAACLGVATLLGWFLVSVGLGFGFFALWGAFFLGAVVGEVALRVTGRKRGPKMEVVSGVSMGVGIVCGWGLFRVSNGLPFVLPQSPWFYGIAAIAVFAAVSRIRYF